MQQNSINPETPDFARVEIRFTDKAGLRSTADHLRSLADNLEKLASGSLPDPMSNYLAWGSIKSTSKKLRNQDQ